MSDQHTRDRASGQGDSPAASHARICNRCKKTKPLSAFELSKRNRGGRLPVCRSCRAVYRAKLKARVKVESASKVCSVCGEEKGSDTFARDCRSADGRSPRCRECRAKKRASEDPATIRRRFFRWKYGIELEEYDRRLAAQGGVCAICQSPPRFGRKHLDVDHDHSTGDIRGLLCSPCNTALGLLGEDPSRVIRLASYLREHQCKTT
jgi:hypothetical protein